MCGVVVIGAVVVGDGGVRVCVCMCVCGCVCVGVWGGAGGAGLRIAEGTHD